VLQTAVNNWRDKSSNVWLKTEQTVRVFSAQHINCSMWLDRRQRNFGYQWTSLFLGREECLWYQTAVADGPEELKLVEKTHSNTKVPDHADPCKPAWQFWIQFVDGLEANADRATHVWCGRKKSLQIAQNTCDVVERSQCRSRNTCVMMWSNFRVLESTEFHKITHIRASTMKN